MNERDHPPRWFRILWARPTVCSCLLSVCRARQILSLSSFKRKLKTYLFENYQHSSASMWRFIVILMSFITVYNWLTFAYLHTLFYGSITLIVTIIAARMRLFFAANRKLNRQYFQNKHYYEQLIRTIRMAIANGTWVSLCNQPKAQFGYLRCFTPVCRCLHPFCGWRHLATSRESNAAFKPAQLVARNKHQVARNLLRCCKRGIRHILASPGYAPGTIAVNVTWMERGFNAGQMHRSMYPSIFNVYEL